MTCGIYALVDPFTERVMYVGKSYDIEKRYDQHMSDSSLSNLDLKNYLSDLKYVYKTRPALHVLEECERETISEKESFWIKEYTKSGQAIFNKMLIVVSPKDADEEMAFIYLIAITRALLSEIRSKALRLYEFKRGKTVIQRLQLASIALQDIQDDLLSEDAARLCRNLFHDAPTVGNWQKYFVDAMNKL